MRILEPHLLEEYAIRSVKGATELERELAASNLLAAAKDMRTELLKLLEYRRQVANLTVHAMPGSVAIILEQLGHAPGRLEVATSSNAKPATLVPGQLRVVPNPDGAA